MLESSSRPARRSVVALTILTLIAFAANSVICRLALGEETIDAVGFTAVRLVSGALTLLLLCVARRRAFVMPGAGDWISAVMLFVYAATFSLAYLSLSTGTGALILFGAVQVTMIVVGLAAGERLHPLQWGGLVAALTGLVYLVSPGLSAPSPGGAVLMAVAGVAWGVYSLRGGGSDPVATTAGNFVRAAPLALVAGAVMYSELRLTLPGVLLAVFSGAVTSGIGYVLWYAALRGLTTTSAAVLQLSVPVLAALGGVALMSETVTMRLVVASAVTLGGVGLAVLGRRRRQARTVRTATALPEG